MSTATATSVTGSVPGLYRAILCRFVWKEYRMLRGFWLAVVAMGAMMQWALNLLMPSSVDHAAMLFAAGLAAAVLYAVGAAATTFSVEHEEETYGFLAGLPTQWWPIFIGKQMVVAASAALLVAVLTVVGWLLCAFRLPDGNNLSLALGILGVAIVEAIAWGTLFSALVKRPLVAATMTLVVGGAAVNVAVTASSSNSVASMVPQSYVDAIPTRLAILVLVLAGSTLAGRRWISVAPRPACTPRIRSVASWLSLGKLVTVPANGIADFAARGFRRRMLLRLLWQTWRESWKLLPVPVLVAIVLWVVIAAVLGIGNIGDEPTGLAIIASLHFVPALFGAMTFHIDQKRGSYQFLAEHAARPRYVWLARQTMWLGALVILYLIAGIAIASFMGNAFNRHMQDSLTRYLYSGQQAIYTSVPNMTYELARNTNFAYVALGLAWTGLLTAYAIGQLCSMLLRSEILAAFIAVVLSTVLSAWVAALFAWQLNGWLVLPLAAGLFAATWLRAPGWITGRNDWRCWWKPLAAITSSLVLLGILLPTMRLAQVPPIADPIRPASSPSPETAKALAALEETTAEYVKVAERLAAGPKENLLARWPTADPLGSPEGLQKNVPDDEMDEFLEADHKRRVLQRAVIDKAVADTIELSKRPAAPFDFNLGMIALHPVNATRELSLDSYLPYARLKYLLETLLYAPQIVDGLAAGDDETTDATATSYSPVERALAALRVSAHIRNGQPSVVFVDQLREERRILEYIGEWAQQEGRTEEELRDALKRLHEHFDTAGHSIDAAAPVLADDWLVREVTKGKEPSVALALQPEALNVHLALLANRLPWEQERALRAIDRITKFNLERAREGTWNTPEETWIMAEPAAATSYLARFEYLARSSMRELRRAERDTETCRRAALLRIALALYRLDHGEYPPRLTMLAPDYLPTTVLQDPYSSQPFQYEPVGLELKMYGWNSQRSSLIEPHTPFFWSVGPADARLTQGAVVVHDPDEEAAEGQVEQQYQLTIGRWENWYPSDTMLIFPLTKLDTQE